MKLADLDRVNELKRELHQLRPLLADPKVQVRVASLPYDHALNAQLEMLGKPLARSVIGKMIGEIEVELRQLGVQVG